VADRCEPQIAILGIDDNVGGAQRRLVSTELPPQLRQFHTLRSDLCFKPAARFEKIGRFRGLGRRVSVRHYRIQFGLVCANVPACGKFRRLNAGETPLTITDAS
jgi:hypothetical protein